MLEGKDGIIGINQLKDVLNSVEFQTIGRILRYFEC